MAIRTNTRSMEATVKAGDLNVGAFAGAKTEDSFGLLHRASWSGKGKYTLRANLGAGNLVLAEITGLSA